MLAFSSKIALWLRLLCMQICIEEKGLISRKIFRKLLTAHDGNVIFIFHAKTSKFIF
jgi:hypothetical protein